MTMERMERLHYSTWCDLKGIWSVRLVKDFAEFEDVVSGFLSPLTCWGKFDFDDDYTRERMVSDWRSFLAGITWSMNN